MEGSEALERLRKMVLPIIDSEVDRQPCLSCLYWGKECAVDLEWVYIKEGKAILICVIKMRDYLNRKGKEPWR